MVLPIGEAEIPASPGSVSTAVAAGSIGAFHAAFFFGTLAPFLRASESPIAMACLRLFTVPPRPPLPDLSVPLFSRCIALFTALPAAFPYLRLPDFFFELERFLVAIFPP